ncbi:hypothetical protein BG011_006741 [Mortierella polycephala]|uniref:Uncharacterized protein n=1 Tax=Mortierella polycephala TaxID=41804 RepID=A0A9P6TZ46_9FUNG|nr:hypothetical protein BG011_006741 [Mortierella polycephala]
MAKKDKKGEGVVQNREIFQRMNFLYQAAMCMATITTPHPPTVDDQDCNASSLVASETVPGTKPDGISSQSDLSKENKDVEMGAGHIRPKGPLLATNTTTTQHQHPPKKLSRRRRRILQREFKNKVAMEMISANKAHHSLTQHTRHHDLHQLSGTARFYASTLREIGRKNVIRM